MNDLLCIRRRRICGSIPTEARDISLVHISLTDSGAHPATIANEMKDASRKGKLPAIDLTTNLYLVPRLRMDRVVPPLTFVLCLLRVNVSFTVFHIL